MRGMAGRCGAWRGMMPAAGFVAVRRAVPEAQEQPGRFTPPVDIYEDEQGIVLTLEVPGVREADIRIQVEGTNLEVSGERKPAEGVKPEGFRRRERVFGSFRRVFRMPPTVAAENIAASYADGVLTITLAKKPESQPRTIPVGRA